MELEDRFQAHLYRLGVKLLTGKRSRCFRSISCYTPPMCGRPGVVSIHPELAGPRAVEALMLQVGVLTTADMNKRFRFTDLTPDNKIVARGFRWAARVLMPERDWDAAMRQRMEGHDLEERFGVTARLVTIRWNLWAAKRGDTMPLFVDDRQYSRVYHDEPMWCEIV